MSLIANARMYAVTPAAETAWRDLIARVCAEAEVALDYLPYPAPRPLEQLWARPDLGAVQMCGYPIAMGLAAVEPIAAPIPALDWARGRAVYRSDLIVRADSGFRTLADTFGGRVGWTVDHSHSGFNALRHHLLRHFQARGPLYAEVKGDKDGKANLALTYRVVRKEVKGASAILAQRVLRGDDVLVTADVRVAAIADGKAARLPLEVREKLAG